MSHDRRFDSDASGTNQRYCLPRASRTPKSAKRTRWIPMLKEGAKVCSTTGLAPSSLRSSTMGVEIGFDTYQ